MLGGAIGLFIGSVAVLAFRASEREQAAPDRGEQGPSSPRGTVLVLQALRSATVVLRPFRTTSSGSSPTAYALGAAPRRPPDPTTPSVLP